MCTIAIGADLAKRFFNGRKGTGQGTSGASGAVARGVCAVAGRAAGGCGGGDGSMQRGAHYWARRCLEYALAPRVIAAQFVTPFRKARRTQNDRTDAEVARASNASEFKRHGSCRPG